MDWVSAIGSFVAGIAKALVLPIFAWLSGWRKAKNQQNEDILDDVEAAKRARDELDQLDAVALRKRGERWVRKRDAE